MPALSYSPMSDRQLADQLGVSEHAVALARDADFLDLHIDSFITTRLVGYALHRQHGTGLLGGRFFGQLDFPRAILGGLSGGMWSITTNPFRSEEGRWRTFLGNLARLRALVEDTGGACRVVRTFAEYRAAREAGALACLLAIQGGNALSPRHGYAAAIPGDVITRVTLVHLTHSLYGRSSAPVPTRRSGLTDAGRELVRSLNERRVFVDLAHIHPSAFWDAVEAHDKGQPLLVTHTGVTGVKPHWRNVDDAQLRAVADTGGVVGIIYQESFLTRPGGPRGVDMVLEHLEHVVRVAGEDAAAIGSDYDGAIVPPKELRDGLSHPRVVDAMLRRGWPEARIRKVLGGNFLRAFEALRPA